MREKRTSPHLRWLAVAVVCMLAIPALLLTSCDNLFGSDSSGDSSAAEMPIAALVGAMGTLHEAIEAAEKAMDSELDSAGTLNALDAFEFIPPSILVEPLGEGVYHVNFSDFKPFDDDITFRTVHLSAETALTGQVTVAFTESGETSTITVNGTVNVANYPAGTVTYSNVVMTLEDEDNGDGDDFPDAISGTVTVDGTTWSMDHVYRVFFSGMLSSLFLSPAGVDDTSAGGVFALFWNIYRNVYGQEDPTSPDTTVEIDVWEMGDGEDVLHLSFADHGPGPGTSVTGTLRGIVDNPEPDVDYAWPQELRAELTVAVMDPEGDEYTIELRDAVLRLPRDWENEAEWTGITWGGLFGVNGAFFRLDYLLDVMHVMSAMGMLDDNGNGNGPE